MLCFAGRKREEFKCIVAMEKAVLNVSLCLAHLTWIADLT